MAARIRRAVAALCFMVAGCATQEPPAPARQDQLPGQIMRLLPATLPDRAGWAADIYAAFATQGIAPSPENVCAVLAVTEQESSFRADPGIAGPGGDRLARDRQPRRAHRRAEVRRSCRPAVGVIERPHIQRADRRGEDGARAERDLRGLHRRRSPRHAALRPAQPRAHRRADAGQHRVRRGARDRPSVSVSDERIDPPRSLHAARRDVFRHRAPAGLRGAVHRTAVPLRRLQCRAVREPQCRVPGRAEPAVRHSPGARRRPAAAGAQAGTSGRNRRRRAGARAAAGSRRRRASGATSNRAIKPPSSARACTSASSRRPTAARAARCRVPSSRTSR